MKDARNDVHRVVIAPGRAIFDRARGGAEKQLRSRRQILPGR
jgi:hypothetical protein